MTRRRAEHGRPDAQRARSPGMRLQKFLSDAGVASLMCLACAEGAALNVLINLASIEDGEFRAARKRQVIENLGALKAALSGVLTEVRSKLENAVQ